MPGSCSSENNWYMNVSRPDGDHVNGHGFASQKTCFDCPPHMCISGTFSDQYSRWTARHEMAREGKENVENSGEYKATPKSWLLFRLHVYAAPDPHARTNPILPAS